MIDHFVKGIAVLEQAHHAESVSEVVLHLVFDFRQAHLFFTQPCFAIVAAQLEEVIHGEEFDPPRILRIVVQGNGDVPAVVVSHEHFVPVKAGHHPRPRVPQHRCAVQWHRCVQGGIIKRTVVGVVFVPELLEGAIDRFADRFRAALEPVLVQIPFSVGVTRAIVGLSSDADSLVSGRTPPVLGADAFFGCILESLFGHACSLLRECGFQRVQRLDFAVLSIVQQRGPDRF
mmetsp:Transcript_68057/g.138434  ORF Transcript_68057/g.138434 Transcript_68057/m.138434 type:complete len:231 (+) Transcript_68057:1275-1967(+)